MGNLDIEVRFRGMSITPVAAGARYARPANKVSVLPKLVIGL